MFLKACLGTKEENIKDESLGKSDKIEDGGKKTLPAQLSTSGLTKL